MTSTHKIVGAFYRPPAQGLLKVMPSGCPLSVIHDSENEHDANAMAVFINTSDLDFKSEEQRLKLDEAVAEYGFSIDEVYQKEAWQLGFIPKGEAAELVHKKDKIESASLTFSIDAKPLVTIKFK